VTIEKFLPLIFSACREKSIIPKMLFDFSMMKNDIRGGIISSLQRWTS